MESELMTRIEVCELLKVKHVTLWKYIKFCGLPYIECDFGRKRFLRSSILEWLKSHEKRQATLEPPTGMGNTTRRDAIF